MDLTREAIKEIIKGGEHQSFEFAGRNYIAQGGNIEEVYPFSQACLSITTLEGLVDYIKCGVDFDVHKNDLTITIDSRSTVYVFKQLDNRLSRELVVKSEAVLPRLCLDRSIDSEQFIVELLSNYLETPERNLLIESVSNMSDQQEVKTTDDGISQELTVKKGVRKEGQVIKNPVMLRPICTFTEVEQPERPFIFRVKDINNITLYEGNDTIWINKAKNRIKEYLKEELQEFKDIKIIL